jgi:hypothetical protein
MGTFDFQREALRSHKPSILVGFAVATLFLVDVAVIASMLVQGVYYCLLLLHMQ